MTQYQVSRSTIRYKHFSLRPSAGQVSKPKKASQIRPWRQGHVAKRPRVFSHSDVWGKVVSFFPPLSGVFKLISCWYLSVVRLFLLLLLTWNKSVYCPLLSQAQNCHTSPHQKQTSVCHHSQSVSKEQHTFFWLCIKHYQTRHSIQLHFGNK